jgi:hypothetical protein
MFLEYEMVKSKFKLSDKVEKGTSGAIVMIYQDSPMSYEVEFVDNDGYTIDVLTVKEYEIEKKFI